jgi:hypothetical protein
VPDERSGFARRFNLNSQLEPSAVLINDGHGVFFVFGYVNRFRFRPAYMSDWLNL